MSDELEIPELDGAARRGGVYRPARPRGRGVLAGMDPGTRRLTLVAAGVAGALAVVVVAWSAVGHRSGPVPVIEADGRPMKVRPDNPGGMQVTGQDETILSGADATTGGKLAAAPEAPAPQALRAPPPPAPAAQPVSLPAVAQVPAPPVAIAAAPEGKPAPPKPAAAHAAATVPPGAHSALVQLAALETEAAANAEWERLTKRMPDLLGGRRPAVSKTERDGKTWFRLRTGGFTDMAQATQFCERVRAKGTGCSLASF